MRPPDDRAVAQNPNRPLHQGGVSCHVREQDVVALVTREAKLAIGLVPRTQQVFRTCPEFRKHIPQLPLAERVFGVLTIGEGDPLFFQQGDRLATRASGGFADQGQHGRFPQLE